MLRHPFLNEIIAFIAVADHGSFTQAASALDTTKSGIGKAVKKLEVELGLKLFNRTTRRVRLTEEGKIFLEATKHAIETINEARLVLDARKAEPAGRLRVNLPIGTGRNVVNSLKQFTKRYPKVTLELSLSDRFDDAIQGEWDIVVRIGELEDSTFIARKLCQSNKRLCASPEYLAERGYPQTIQDLRSHDALVFRSPTGKVRHWEFKGPDGLLTEFSPSPLAIFADGRTMVDATVSGLGIAQVYDNVLGTLLDENKLVELFPDMRVPGPPVNALIPSGRVMPAKTKVFIEFLKDLLG